MLFAKNLVLVDRIFALRGALLLFLLVGSCVAAAAEQPQEQKDAGKEGGDAEKVDAPQEEGEGDGAETVGINPIIGNLVGAGIVAVLGLVVFVYFKYCRSASAEAATTSSAGSGQLSAKVEYSKVATDDVEKGLSGSRSGGGATSIRSLGGGGPRIELAGRSRDRTARSSTSRSPSPSSTASSESPSTIVSSSYEEAGTARHNWDDWEGEASGNGVGEGFDAPEMEDENAEFLSHERSSSLHPQHIHVGGVVGQDIQGSSGAATSISSLGGGRLGGLSSSKGKLAKSPAPKQSSVGKSRASTMSSSANVNDDLFESIGLSAKPKFNETSSNVSASSSFKSNPFGSLDNNNAHSKHSPGGARKQRVADIAAAEESTAAWGGAEDDITFDD